jgi:hypothetical protein
MKHTLLEGAPGLLIFAGHRLVSHRLPHPAPLTLRSLHPLQDFGEKVKYFEVTILSLCPDGPGITVGLTSKRASLHEPLGHATKCLGWSSTGVLFAGSPGNATRFGVHTGGGARFGVGEVIGCGYDDHSRDLFFTRNGVRIAATPATRALKREAVCKSFPAVCLSSPHDTVLLNLDCNFMYQHHALNVESGAGAGAGTKAGTPCLLMDKGIKALRSDRTTIRLVKKDSSSVDQDGDAATNRGEHARERPSRCLSASSKSTNKSIHWGPSPAAGLTPSRGFSAPLAPSPWLDSERDGLRLRERWIVFRLRLRERWIES